MSMMLVHFTHFSSSFLYLKSLPPCRCALHIAVSSGKYDVAEWLIKEHSAEIHMKDFESGWNALHRSLFYGNIDCAILLIKVQTLLLFGYEIA